MPTAPNLDEGSRSATSPPTEIPREPGNENELGKELGSGQAIPPNGTGKSIWYRVFSFLLFSVVVGGLYVTRERWEPVLEGWIRPAASERPAPRPPLVSVATAKKESIPQYLNCLGTVTAFNSVTVRSRVDGELVDVAFQEGQMVEEGQLLARVDSRGFEAALSQAKGQLERDMAALELARLNFERSKNLPVGATLSQQERDELQAVYKQAQALVDVDRATVTNAELQVTYCNITAPIRGRVGLRLVDQGNMIQASSSMGIAVITQLQPISVLFPIPQDEIPRVQSQLLENKSLSVIAYDRSFQNKLAEGTLTAIDNQVDPTTGTLRLKATFANENDALFPNQFVNVRLLVKMWEDAVVVPSSAVQRGADFLYVYVVQADNLTVDIAKVTVAFSEAGRSVIASGLQEGDRVVTEGTDKLQPKGKITIPGAGPNPK
jgi:multidrug efflux system membrane fusion protein